MGYAKVSLTFDPSEDDSEVVFRITSEDGKAISADTLLVVMQAYISQCQQKINKATADRSSITIQNLSGVKLKESWH